MSQPTSFVYPRPGIPQAQDPLYNLGNLDKVHYEASLNGPHNMFLNCYFPATSTFMVKPVPRLRRSIPSGSPPAGRTSIDSYDQEVETSRKDDIPDFVVCKSGADLHGDIPLIVWELKRDDADGSRTATQLDRYRAWNAAYEAKRALVGEPHFVALAVVEQALVTFSTPTAPNSFRVKYANVLDARSHTVLAELRLKFE
ncbi:hypothetical protein BDZ89DRAFT_1076268 [Hymenopellis radicata]|nr:hypothetical protein BDZ89DRAFT_1076268 [Hymenopellis radicata]